jgi:hypothetical protein
MSFANIRRLSTRVPSPTIITLPKAALPEVSVGLQKLDADRHNERRTP